MPNQLIISNLINLVLSILSLLISTMDISYTMINLSEYFSNCLTSITTFLII